MILPRRKRGADVCLYALGQELIAPLADALAGAEHLIVVPHGPLHGVPFHALAGPDGTYLAEDVAISYAPSADVYERCLRDDRQPGERLLLVGVDGDDLPWVRQELKEIAEIWPEAQTRLGKRATRAALRRQAGRFDILHVATHAVARSDNPSFSSIRLADSWLTGSDLADLARGARLVKLAACETGVGTVGPGDEVLGLTRGLLAGGCTAAVASLWPVSDRTTALLMPRFYGALRDGHGPAEAIRLGLVHEADRDVAGSLFAEALACPRLGIAAELRIRLVDNSYRHFDVVATNLLRDPRIVGIVVTFRDITERKEFEETLTYQASHDALTDLPNRTLFREASSAPSIAPSARNRRSPSSWPA